MSFDTFTLITVIPFIISGILMAWAQRRFLNSCREILNPDEPLSSQEAIERIPQKPGNIVKNIFTSDLTANGDMVLKHYFMHHTNPRLEREASLVRKLIFTTVMILILDIILSFFL
jgi:hypothetical protein